jgi:hypothetical protein
MKAYGGGRCMAPHIINFGTGRRWVVSFTLLPGKDPCTNWIKDDEFQSGSEMLENRKVSCFTEIGTAERPFPTDWAVASSIVEKQNEKWHMHSSGDVHKGVSYKEVFWGLGVTVRDRRCFGISVLSTHWICPPILKKISCVDVPSYHTLSKRIRCSVTSLLLTPSAVVLTPPTPTPLLSIVPLWLAWGIMAFYPIHIHYRDFYMMV